MAAIEQHCTVLFNNDRVQTIQQVQTQAFLFSWFIHSLAKTLHLFLFSACPLRILFCAPILCHTKKTPSGGNCVFSFVVTAVCIPICGRGSQAWRHCLVVLMPMYAYVGRCGVSRLAAAVRLPLSRVLRLRTIVCCIRSALIFQVSSGRCNTNHILLYLVRTYSSCSSSSGGRSGSGSGRHTMDTNGCPN